MGTLEDYKAEIEEATSEDVPLDDRVALLESIREELTSTLDIVNEKLAEAAANPDERRPSDIEFAISHLRDRAEVAQEQLDAGNVTEAELTEAGIFTTRELDALEEEELLETAAQELIEAGKIELPDEAVA